MSAAAPEYSPLHGVASSAWVAYSDRFGNGSRRLHGPIDEAMQQLESAIEGDDGLEDAAREAVDAYETRFGDCGPMDEIFKRLCSAIPHPNGRTP